VIQVHIKLIAKYADLLISRLFLILKSGSNLNKCSKLLNTVEQI